MADWLSEAIRAKFNRVETDPEPDPDAPKPFPDLGQGARGPGPAEPPNVDDLIRGHVRAKSRVVHEEISQARAERLLRGQ